MFYLGSDIANDVYLKIYSNIYFIQFKLYFGISSVFDPMYGIAPIRLNQMPAKIRNNQKCEAVLQTNKETQIL